MDRRDGGERPSVDLGDPGVVDIPVPRAASTFDPEPSREETRGWLALGSFLLLVVTVVIVLLVVALDLRSWDEMQGVVACILPAVMSVVGSSLGFYFGARAREVRR